MSLAITPLRDIDPAAYDDFLSSPFFGSLGGDVSEDRPARQALWYAFREIAQADGVAAGAV